MCDHPPRGHHAAHEIRCTSKHTVGCLPQACCSLRHSRAFASLNFIKMPDGSPQIDICKKGRCLIKASCSCCSLLRKTDMRLEPMRNFINLQRVRRIVLLVLRCYCCSLLRETDMRLEPMRNFIDLQRVRRIAFLRVANAPYRRMMSHHYFFTSYENISSSSGSNVMPGFMAHSECKSKL